MYPQLHEMYKHNIVTEFKDIWAFRHFFSLFSNDSQLPRARAQVGVGPMTWDNNIVAYAHSYVISRMGNCNLIHSSGPFGENLAEGSGSFIGTDGVTL
ncbi:hypothetical protein ACSBR1_019609 [Camellia fascicularis]